MPADRNPTVRRRRLGAELKALREAAGLTCEAVAEHLDCHPTKVGRVENGRSPSKSLELQVMLDLYGVTDACAREAILHLSKESRRRCWWHQYGQIGSPFADFLSLETSARAASEYEITFVPGLLQTPDYARAIEAVTQPEVTATRSDELIEIRLNRQRTLDRDDFRLWVVVGEAALRHTMGDARTMTAQLQHLAEQQERTNVDLQVLPLPSSAHAMSGSAFVVLSFPEAGDRDVVYVDNLLGTLYFEQEDEVARYQYAFDRLRAAALPLDESMALIRQMAKDA